MVQRVITYVQCLRLARGSSGLRASGSLCGTSDCELGGINGGYDV